MRSPMIWFRLIALSLCLGVLTSAASAGENEEKIRKALEDRTEMEFTETPLTLVLDYIKERHRIEIQPDAKALRDAGVDLSTTPITRNIRGITVRSALNLLLADLDMAYAIDNEVLLITTKDKAERMMETRVYDVGDLIRTAEDKDGRTDFSGLTKMITSTITPHSWKCGDGYGDVAALCQNGLCVLAVRQTAEQHEAVEKLLNDLREVKRQKPKQKKETQDEKSENPNPFGA